MTRLIFLLFIIKRQGDPIQEKLFDESEKTLSELEIIKRVKNKVEEGGNQDLFEEKQEQARRTLDEAEAADKEERAENAEVLDEIEEEEKQESEKSTKTKKPKREPKREAITEQEEEVLKQIKSGRRNHIDKVIENIDDNISMPQIMRILQSLEGKGYINGNEVGGYIRTPKGNSYLKHGATEQEVEKTVDNSENISDNEVNDNVLEEVSDDDGRRNSAKGVGLRESTTAFVHSYSRDERDSTPDNREFPETGRETENRIDGRRGEGTRRTLQETDGEEIKGEKHSENIQGAFSIPEERGAVKIIHDLLKKIGITIVTGKTEGKRGRTNTIYEDIWDRIIRGSGFKSVDESLASDKKRIISNETNSYNKERQKVIDALVDVPYDKDAQKKAKKFGITGKQVKEERRKKNMTLNERTQNSIPKKRKDDFKYLTDF